MCGNGMETQTRKISLIVKCGILTRKQAKSKCILSTLNITDNLHYGLTKTGIYFKWILHDSQDIVHSAKKMEVALAISCCLDLACFHSKNNRTTPELGTEQRGRQKEA